MKPSNAIMRRHGSPNDWCHLCGERSDYNTDIWYAENAEHDGRVSEREAATNDRYLRVCRECGIRISNHANAEPT